MRQSLVMPPRATLSAVVCVRIHGHLLFEFYRFDCSCCFNPLAAKLTEQDLLTSCVRRRVFFYEVADSSFLTNVKMSPHIDLAVNKLVLSVGGYRFLLRPPLPLKICSHLVLRTRSLNSSLAYRSGEFQSDRPSFFLPFSLIRFSISSLISADAILGLPMMMPALICFFAHFAAV